MLACQMGDPVCLQHSSFSSYASLVMYILHWGVDQSGLDKSLYVHARAKNKCGQKSAWVAEKRPKSTVSFSAQLFSEVGSIPVVELTGFPLMFVQVLVFPKWIQLQ